MAAYQKKLGEVGLYSNDVRLWVNQEIRSDWQYYMKTTPDIYTAKKGEIRFLSGIYTIYGSGRTELWRKDYQGSLDEWR